jgi:hypothetical protein
MDIKKQSWSDKRKNHLVNFYVLEPEPGKAPEVLSMPFSMASPEDAKNHLNRQRDTKGLPSYEGYILHVILDMSSGRLYVPNSEDESELRGEGGLAAMFEAAKFTAQKLAGDLPLAPTIIGDPFDTIRIREVADFPSASEFIAKQVASQGGSEVRRHLNIPVVEADLGKMPKTCSLVPSLRGKGNIKSVYVSDSDMDSVEFFIRKQSGPKEIDTHVASVKTPLILLYNPEKERLSGADKERLVTILHKEFDAEFQADRRISPSLLNSPDVKAIKYLLYIGWSFRDLCASMLSADKVSDMNDLVYKGAFIYNAAKAIAAEGFPDPSSKPYYYTFEIGENFPIRFRPEITDEPYDVSGKPEFMQVIHFDPRNEHVVVKTPLFLEPNTIRKCLGAESDPLTCQYDDFSSMILTDATKDTGGEATKSLNVIHKDVIANGGEPVEGANRIQFKRQYLTDMYFNRSRISDFPQASEIIKRICEQVSTKDVDVKFDDIEVIVGPWWKVNGALGGYYNRRRFDAANIPIPYEAVDGVFITPPCIIVDNVQTPSAGDRIETIVHEYRHHINARLWVESPEYESPGGMDSAEDIKKWQAYLKSPDEHLAHKTQFKYMLALGVSKEALLRKSMADARVRANHIPIARLYMEIINEAAAEIDHQKQVQQADEAIQKAIESGGIDFSEVDDAFDPDEFNF